MKGLENNQVSVLYMAAATVILEIDSCLGILGAYSKIQKGENFDQFRETPLRVDITEEGATVYLCGQIDSDLYITMWAEDETGRHEELKKKVMRAILKHPMEVTLRDEVRA